ncbi:hypothetical protein [Leucothrix pacifica]|uniref:Uncharacterized protein n=1 Tax=Leucothrix pacifica TaxID=1247513 RepID=A0A317CMV4_9GAMM|nr:hypothetical protein [Leucothrix pacifica]PWQ99878.1 hypothetical protein DKW60_04220 [Leucothrix pacifica]
MQNTLTPSGSRRSQLLLVFGVVLLLLVIYALTFSLDASGRDFWLSEGGIVESLSALGYFVCAALMLLMGGWHYVKKYHYLFMLVLLFGMRELDFDKRFTTMGIFKSKFYASSDVPMIEKVIGLIVIAIFFYIVFRLVKNHLKDFITGVLRFSPAHLAVFFAMSFIFISKTLDGIARKLGGFGITIEQSASVYFQALEEILEMGIPVLLMLSVYLFLSRHKQ